MVSVSGHPILLSTTYHAVVDATNGNTTLDPVHATFLNTSLTARGGVYEVKGVKGRVVKLDIAMDEGRLEDLMRLAVRTPRSPMTGRLHLLTKFTLPPGDRDVVDKLLLDGRFSIQGGRFTDTTVQTKVNELSRRASVREPETAPARGIGSNFAGRFSLGQSRLTLPTVTFDVPGALVELSGQYGIKEEDIAFDGNLYMDAKISQTVTGFKSLLLKVVDPLFRRNGRTVVPLRINGTRNDPQFGVNVRRVFRRGPARPH
jgi:autotransporter translocation and assembly factor TamB